MVERRQTPSQTVGPFFGVGLTRASQSQSVMVNELTEGERIRIEGTVFDGAGAPIEDALVEIWQANAHGRYRHDLDAGPAPLDPNFFGFGRCPTDANGAFHFETVKPGAIQPATAGRTPRTSTSPCSPAACLSTPTRGCISTAMRSTPIRRWRWSNASGAARSSASEQRRVMRAVYRWDIHLQGDRETVFFDA